MDKQKFIELYQARINRVKIGKNDHYIKDNHICNIYLDKELKIDIQDCLTIIDLFNQAKKYLYNLKKGDKAIFSKYSSNDNVEILKVNYTRRYDKKGNKIISTFGVKILYDNGNYCITQCKPGDFNFKGISIRKLFNSYLHVTGYFLSFSEYDVKDVKEILENVIEKKEVTL